MHSGILLQEGKADSDGNSLFVLGSLADLQQGTFDVTYLSLFFSFNAHIYLSELTILLEYGKEKN